MRDLIILPSWLVVNPSPEPEVTEPFWSEWFSDEERSDEVAEHERIWGCKPEEISCPSDEVEE